MFWIKAKTFKAKRQVVYPWHSTEWWWLSGYNENPLHHWYIGTLPDKLSVLSRHFFFKEVPLLNPLYALSVLKAFRPQAPRQWKCYWQLFMASVENINAYVHCPIKFLSVSTKFLYCFFFLSEVYGRKKGSHFGTYGYLNSLITFGSYCSSFCIKS